MAVIVTPITPPVAGTITVSVARVWVRQFARNAGDSSVYSDADIDRAIQIAATEFIQQTRSTVRVDAITIQAGESAAVFSSLTGFRPERIKRAYLADRGLLIRSWDEVIALPACTGTPDSLAFEDWANAIVYPTPTTETTIKVRWWEPFTSWTLGVADATAQTIFLNLPDDWLTQILTYGATSILQHNDPQQLYANASYQKFQAFIKSMIGAGNMGAKVSYRTE